MPNFGFEDLPLIREKNIYIQQEVITGIISKGCLRTASNSSVLDVQ